MIWFEIVLKLVENGLDFLLTFVGNLSNLSINKRSWNNWVVLKRIDGCQVRLPPECLVDTSQILSSCPANAPT